MNQFYVWLAGSSAILLLASCSKPPAPTSGAVSASIAANQATAPTKLEGSGLTALRTVVTKTKAAVEAGNFEQAKTEFGNFETFWQTVEDGIKTKSSATYTAIEDAMNNVNDGIKDKNKEQALRALQTLTQQLATLAKA